MSDKRIILIRITKCGGTSFENVIMRQRLPILKFTPTFDNVNKYQNNINEYSDMYHFSIIRNPYDKVVSSYKWLTVSNGKNRMGKFKEFINSNTSLNDFLKRYVEYKDKYDDYNFIKNKSGVIYPRKNENSHDKYNYFWWMQHMEGMYETIDTFINPDKIFTFIRLENYSEDLEKIEKLLDVKIIYHT